MSVEGGLYPFEGDLGGGAVLGGGVAFALSHGNVGTQSINQRSFKANGIDDLDRPSHTWTARGRVKQGGAKRFSLAFQARLGGVGEATALFDTE